MQTLETVKAPAIFVVVLREVLVAQDIEAILYDSVPEAQVIVATTLEEAEAALEGAALDGAVRVAAAFVQLDPAEVAGSALGRRVAADGGRLVLLTLDVPGALPPGWTAMPLPFAEADVTAHLTGGHPSADHGEQPVQSVTGMHWPDTGPEH